MKNRVVKAMLYLLTTAAIGIAIPSMAKPVLAFDIPDSSISDEEEDSTSNSSSAATDPVVTPAAPTPTAAPQPQVPSSVIYEEEETTLPTTPAQPAQPTQAPAADTQNTQKDQNAAENKTTQPELKSGVESENANAGGDVKADTSGDKKVDETPAPVVKPGTGSRVIVDPGTIENHHFWQVGKRPLFARHDMNIYEEKKEDAKVVGTASLMNLMYQLRDEKDGWLYVESGNVRGFIKSEDVFSGKKAERMAFHILEKKGLKTDEEKSKYDWSGHFAKATVDPSENSAFAYFRATTNRVVVKKKYAVPNATDYINIREEKSKDARVVGKLPADAFAYVLDESDPDWLYVESGDVRGYVSRTVIRMDDDIQKQVKEKGEDSYKKAESLIDVKDNKAFYASLNTVESGRPDGQIGESLVEYASNYVGNPYVWGGTSLTDGADCSGFVQSIYRQYGISLPRVAADQAQAGTAIPIEDAMPGDLVFYSNAEEGIYHVMIYAGDGQTVEAYGTNEGIIHGTYDASKGLDYAVRVLDQTKDPLIVSDGESEEITPQAECGGICTYEKWNTNWVSGTLQKALYDLYENYDDEGFGKIGDRYVIACTSTFGRVGDLIDFELADGTVVKTVMGDAKNMSDAGCNLYGHLGGQNVLEFIVNGDIWYNTGHANPGTSKFYPSFGQKVVKAINYGNILG